MLRIALLGDLRLEVDGARAALPASRRARSLLAWLALHPGEHPRSEVAGRFWPDVLESSARTSLRGAIAELRRSLGTAADALIATRDRVGLARGDAVWIDADELERRLGAGDVRAALELVRGDLLAGLDDEWILPLREAHRREVLTLHGRLAEEAEARGDVAEALAHTRRQAELEPLSEEVHRALMRRLAGAGDRAAAVTTYRALEARLRRDLAMAPAPETRALLDALRAEGAVGPTAGTVAAAEREPTPDARPRPGQDGAPLPLPGALAAERAPVVGRDAELQRIEAAWKDACGGTARLVLLAGDPGIGKTTLAREAGRRAAAQGATVLYGRADEEGIVPYEPWVQIATHAVTHAGDATIERLTHGVGPELARLAPELRRRVPDLPQPLQAEPDTERWRLFDALAGLLDELSAERPVLVVLDDLHWADRSTLLLLRHVVRSKPTACVLVVGTYRAIELDPDGPLAAALADLRREHLFAELDVTGLEKPAVAAMVARRRGDDQADPSFVQALFQETEGNPFFVEEVLRNQPGAGVPQGVREAVGRRLAALAPPVLELLSAASVIGRDFDLDVLARIGADDQDALLARLDEAIAAQVIEEIGVGRYSFLHALIRATLYDDLSLTRRARLHLKIGQALEELREDAGRLPYGELAHHFWVAAAGELGRVADYSARAAAEALDQLAYDEAAAHAERALEALDAAKADEPRRRLDLLLLLGEARARAEKTRAARAAFTAAAQLARTARDGRALSAAALGVAGPSWRTFGEVDEEAVALLEEALAAVDRQHGALRARVQARLAIALYFARQPERMQALTDEALTHARAWSDGPALAAALEARLYATWHPDGLAERVATAVELGQLAEREGRPELGALARRWLVVALLEAGEIDRARDETRRHAETAEQLRQPYEQMYVAVFGALWALLEGRYEDAQRHSQAVLAHGQTRGGADALQFVGVQMLTMAQEHGGLEHLVEPLRANADQYPAIPAWRAAVAYCEAVAGDHDAARATLASIAPIPEHLPRDANWMPGMIFAAQAVAVLGDAQAARQLRAALEPYAHHGVLLGAGGALWSTAAHWLAVLCDAAGEREAAARFWTQALARARAMDATPWVARAEHGLAAARGQTPASATTPSAT